MFAASARTPAPMLRTPIAAMNYQASRTFFSAFFRSAGRAARAAPAAAQLAAEEESSCGGADSFGGVHACWAGATAPTAAHMSQLLRPIGMAQPQRLQAAMDLYRTRRADPP